MTVRLRLDLEQFDGVGAVWFEQAGGIVGGQFDVAFSEASVVEPSLGIKRIYGSTPHFTHMPERLSVWPARSLASANCSSETSTSIASYGFYL